jgi:hypothetical protein
MEALENEQNFTKTTNGATALKSTKSDLVNLFGTIGALRNASENEIETKFLKAFAEDNLIALKMLFWARDVRGGLGERKVFRVISKFLANLKATYPTAIKNNLELVSDMGRWDDLWVLLDTPLKTDVVNLVKRQLQEDVKAEYPTLLAKWLPSENTSSKETVKLAKIFIKEMGCTPKQYRKLISKLRKKINIVESLMSSGKWTEIDYARVPSKAMTNYRTAFFTHNEIGMQAYIDSVTKGETKINASTLFPYDILEKMSTYGFDLGRSMKFDQVLEEQWKALPNYIEGENNVLIMADTSGSMCGRPMATSVGLGIYFAERNKGIFHNKFMTFSSRPSFIEIKGETLIEKVKCVPGIVEDTNLEAAFDLILATAVNNKIPQSDMPKALVVISDMQFNSAATDNSGRYTRMTFHDTMVAKYSNYGYEMPNIIYWNVSNVKDSFQVTSEYQGVQLASGQSPSIFKSILLNIGKNPYQAMVDTLDTERYNRVRA